MLDALGLSNLVRATVFSPAEADRANQVRSVSRGRSDAACAAEEPDETGEPDDAGLEERVEPLVVEDARVPLDPELLGLSRFGLQKKLRRTEDRPGPDEPVDDDDR